MRNTKIAEPVLVARRGGEPRCHPPKNPDSLGITGKHSVMLVALRLLHYLGFSIVYLLGCDFKMDAECKYAFDEHGAANAIRHNNVLYDSLSRRFEALKPRFEKHRFRVVNGSPGSVLEVFEKMAFGDAVKAAAAECGKPIRTDGWYEPSPKANAPQQEAARYERRPHAVLPLYPRLGDGSCTPGRRRGVRTCPAAADSL